MVDIVCYNPPNNFCGLSLDKTDHVIQNPTMDIRGYPPSDLILFRRKENQEASKRSRQTLNWSRKTQKNFLQNPVMDK